jgi:hypothetical protein
MADKKLFIIGTIILTIFATIYYVELPSKVKLRFTTDYAELYVNLTGSWELGGKEIYPKLYNGTKLVTRTGKSISYFIDDNIVYYYRTTNYSSGSQILETYVIDGNLSDVENIPLQHKIEIKNANGLIYQYEVQKLSYDGITKNIDGTSYSFDKNIVVEWNEGAYYKKITKSLTDTKLIVKYRITNSDTILYNRLFDPVYNYSVTLYFDGVSANRSYEYQTTANITSSINATCAGCNVTIICIDCPKETNYTFNNSGFYKFSLLQNNNFTAGIIMNSTASFNQDNRTDLINASVNVTSTNNSVNSEITTHAKLPGILTGVYLMQNQFNYLSTLYTATNISFSQASSKTFFINLTTSNLLNQQNTTNISFTLSGFSSDELNSFNYQENFTNKTYVNLTATTTGSNEFLYENFENLYTNSTSRWGFNFVGYSETDSGLNYGYRITSPKSYYRIYHDGGTYCGDGKTQHSYLTLDEIDFRLSDYWNVSYTTTLTNQGQSVSNCANGGQMSQLYYEISDGSTYVTFATKESVPCTITTSSTVTYDETIQTRKTGENNYNFYINDTYQNSFSTATLNPLNTWTLRIHGYTYGLTTGSECNFFRKGIVDLNVRSVSMGAAGSQKSYNSSNYSSTSNFVSTILNETATNITTATLTILDANIEPTSNVKYYLSVNGTWEEVINATRHTFTSVGNKPKINITFNNSDPNISSYVTKYKLEITPSLAQSVVVDLGADSVIEYNRTSVLNGSVNLSYPLSALTSYLSDNCENELICNIPSYIILNSSGIIELSNINVTINPNPISLNVSVFETCNVCNISGDNITFSDLKINYLGSKNYTWTAQAFLGSTAVSDVITYVSKIYYSKFNLTSPVPFWEFKAQQSSQKNIEPTGQDAKRNISIFNITTQAYDNNVNYFFAFNESPSSCLSIWGSTQNNKSINSIIMSNVTRYIQNNTRLGNVTKFYNWVNLTNCSSGYDLFHDDPYNYINSICTNCTITFDAYEER